MLQHIVKGIQVLHNHKPPIMHRDLKTLNVLVTADFSCRVADFGLSRFDTTTWIDTLKKCRGTYAYIAPEVYDAKKYTVQADIYSVAIMIWEFVSRCTKGIYLRPYQEFNLQHEFQILMQAAKVKKRPTIPTTCPPSLNAVISDCWNHDQSKRPDTNILLQRLEEIQGEYQAKTEEWDKLLGKPPKQVTEKKEQEDEENGDDDQ